MILGKGTYLNRGNLSVVQHGKVVDQTLQVVQTLHPELGGDVLSTLREEFKAPQAKFVCATLGQTSKEKARGSEKLLLDAKLAVSNEIDLSIYNVTGQKVATLVSGRQSTGSYQVEWNASGMASGSPG